MKTPTWNDVENGRDLHTGPQRDVPQPEAKQSRTVGETFAAIESMLDDSHRHSETHLERDHYQELIDDVREAKRSHDSLLAALKQLVAAVTAQQSELTIENLIAVSQAQDRARAAIRQCEEGK